MDVEANGSYLAWFEKVLGSAPIGIFVFSIVLSAAINVRMVFAQRPRQLIGFVFLAALLPAVLLTFFTIHYYFMANPLHSSDQGYYNLATNTSIAIAVCTGFMTAWAISSCLFTRIFRSKAWGIDEAIIGANVRRAIMKAFGWMFLLYFITAIVFYASHIDFILLSDRTAPTAFSRPLFEAFLDELTIPFVVGVAGVAILVIAAMPNVQK